MTTDGDSEFFLEGPHCHHHDHCPMDYCDCVETDNPEVYAVPFTCKEVRRCTVCGPTSRAWAVLVPQWITWVTGWCGTAELPKMRELGVPAHVIGMAELVEAHPVAGTR